MAFGTLTIGAATYNSVGSGEYMNSTVALGGPVDMIKLSPGKRANKSAPLSATITRILEKDVTNNGVTSRVRFSVSTQYNVPDGFTSAEIDTATDVASTLATPTFLTRLLMGES